MGWYRSAGEIIRTVLALIDGEVSHRRKEMFVETGSRYFVVVVVVVYTLFTD